MEIKGSLYAGIGSSATGNTSFAFGFNTIASGDYSHAEGFGTSATTFFSHAEGRETIASGEASHAEGRDTTASEAYSHAEGRDTIASGEYSHAEGFNTLASSAASHAEGETTIASGGVSHAQGTWTVADGIASHAGGRGFDQFGRLTANGEASFAHFFVNQSPSNFGAYGDRSAILGGLNHIINTGATNSSIIGGSQNVIDFNVTNSAIVGGNGITAITSNTVHVPSLEINGEVREFGTSTLQGAGTLTISGGVSIVLIKITGADNVTLPNGNIGQKITIYVLSGSGVNTTIGGSFLGYNTVKLTEIGESVQLLYSDDGWVIIGGNNFVAVA